MTAKHSGPHLERQLQHVEPALVQRPSHHAAAVRPDFRMPVGALAEAQQLLEDWRGRAVLQRQQGGAPAAVHEQCSTPAGDDSKKDTAVDVCMVELFHLNEYLGRDDAIYLGELG